MVLKILDILLLAYFSLFFINERFFCKEQMSAWTAPHSH